MNVHPHILWVFAKLWALKTWGILPLYDIKR